MQLDGESSVISSIEFDPVASSVSYIVRHEGGEVLTCSSPPTPFMVSAVLPSHHLSRACCHSSLSPSLSSYGVFQVYRVVSFLTHQFSFHHLNMVLVTILLGLMCRCHVGVMRLNQTTTAAPEANPIH